MKRAIRALISLYPKKWRNRYGGEFSALLSDVSPTWRTFFDVLEGAFKMQWRTWTPLKLIAVFGVVGVVAGVAYSWTVSDRYISTAVIKIGEGGSEQKLNALAQTILSRASLTQIIVSEGLYEGERARMPIEDVIDRMRTQDVMILPVGSGAFSVSFASQDAARAQRTTRSLAAMFIEGKAGSLLNPASVPSQNPRRWRIIVVGLVAGVLLGSLVALFNGLKVWKLAAALGIAGAVLGAAIGLVLPERFASVAALSVESPDRVAAGTRVHRIAEAITTDAKLRAIVQQFKLFPNESGGARRLREHLHIDPTRNGAAIIIRFDDRDRYTAQGVVGYVTWLFMDESVEDAIQSGSTAKETLELLDPASFPVHAYFPNRPMVAGTGGFVGLGCAVLFGFWRFFKRSLPAVAAR
jgi:capsular polysaccharide biosynthesis protein